MKRASIVGVKIFVDRGPFYSNVYPPLAWFDGPEHTAESFYRMVAVETEIRIVMSILAWNGFD